MVKCIALVVTEDLEEEYKSEYLSSRLLTPHTSSVPVYQDETKETGEKAQTRKQNNQINRKGIWSLLDSSCHTNLSRYILWHMGHFPTAVFIACNHGFHGSCSASRARQPLTPCSQRDTTALDCSVWLWILCYRSDLCTRQLVEFHTEWRFLLISAISAEECIGGRVWNQVT